MAVAEESLSNVALVQAYNRQGFEIERFHRENEGALQASLVTSRLKAFVTPLIDTMQGVVGARCACVGNARTP